MNTRTRGLIVFAGIIVVAVVFCGWVPFVFMPNNGIGVALPVIEVPGEVLVEDFLPGFNLTNTLIGTLAADIILIIFVVLAWRVSRGWTKKVPGRFQGMVEGLIGGYYNFCRGIAGDRLRTAPMLWPLVATIFFFLLAANWMKLLPGVESVGKMHCAYAGQSGYAMYHGWTDSSYRLWVDTPLNAGTTQTPETYELCNDYYSRQLFDRFEAEDAATIRDNRAEYETVLAGLPTEAEDRSESQEEQYREARAYVDYADQRVESAQTIAQLGPQIERIEAEISRLESAEVNGEAADNGENDEAVVAMTEAERDARIAELERERDSLAEQLNQARTQIEYPGATLTFTPEQLESGAVPYIFHITPFVRGAATDLSLAFALAIMSITLVQVYGVLALGPSYFEKFINISALGNLGKKPLGLIDFVVGLIEIISEIGKIISLAFRLFGNLFAGGVALMAVAFLVALLIPGVIYVLEIIIGAVQALVFSVLTLVFAVQAMESHHGDHDHADEHEAYYDPDALEGGDEEPVVSSQ
jgi:F0F1-type ATP synthase membrane subunit a